MTDLPSRPYTSLTSESIRRVLSIGEDEPLIFCQTHQVYASVPCPACQTSWPESIPGISCQDCQCCAHGTHPLADDRCPHTCEEICHPGQQCVAGEGHHV